MFTLFLITLGLLCFGKRLKPVVDERIYLATSNYEHLELDLFTIYPEQASDSKWMAMFESLSFPHMAATTISWIGVMAINNLFQLSPGLYIYGLLAVLYLAGYSAAIKLKDLLALQSQTGSNVISAIKLVGLVFVAFTGLMLFLQLIVPFIITLILFSGAMLLALLLLPGFISSAVWKFLFSKLGFLFPAKAKPTSHGSAALASRIEVEQADLLTGDGLMLGQYNNEILRLSGEGHILTVAPAGSGKGIGSVIPNLIQHPGSIVVIDPKGENYLVTSRARAEIGQQVWRLDPFSVSGLPSHALNPIAHLNPNSADLIDDALTIAETIVVREPGDQNPHWNERAATLIQALIIYVVSYLPSDYRDLIQVYQLFTAPEEKFNQHLAIMMQSDVAGGALARAANEIARLNPIERSSVFSTTSRHLNFLNSPRVKECLMSSSFNLDDLKQGKLSIYMILPADKLTSHARLLRLWLNTTISTMIRVKTPVTNRVLFMLDEMAQLGRLESLSNAVRLLRGYGMTMWMILQDLAQLKELYPKSWETFIANTQIQQYFAVADKGTAEYVSALTGQTTLQIINKNTSTTTGSNKGESGGITSGNAYSQGHSHNETESTNESNVARPLFTPDEVRRLPKHKVLIFKQGLQPVLANRLNYLDMPVFNGHFDQNPMH